MVAVVGNPMPVNVVGSSVFGRYPKISPEKTYNMFISDEWLVDYAGYKRLLELVEDTDKLPARGRGIFRSIRGNRLIVVINSTVWSIDAVTGATFGGNLQTSTGPVAMDENLNAQIAITDGLYLYIYNRDANSLNLQTVPDDLLPNYVCFHDTYFLVGNGNITANGSRWYAFSYATAETVIVPDGGQLALQTKPDYAKAIRRLSEKGSNVLVFGTAVTEVQSNTPQVRNGALILYQRVSTMNIDYGVLSVATIDSSDNIVCWLATNEKSPPVIMYFDGSSHHTISSDGINFVLENMQHPETSVGFFYKRDGHLFYQITFYDPADNLSLLYDFNTQKFFHLSDHNLDYHPARQVAYIGNRSFFVSLNNGSLYAMSSNLTTYDENLARPGSGSYDNELNYIIPRQRICENIRIPNTRPDPFCAQKFFLLMEQGEDLRYSKLAYLSACQDIIITEEGEDVLTEQGENVITEDSIQCLEYQPAVHMSFSGNGGVTYSSEQPKVLQFMANRSNITQWNIGKRLNEMTIRLKFWGYGRFVVGNGTLEVKR